MPNEIIDVKQLPKQTVAKFVNDAAEMEVNSYSLKETAKTIKKEIDEKKAATNTILQQWELKVNKQQAAYSAALEQFQNQQTYKEFKDNNNSFIPGLIPTIFFIPIFLITLVIYLLIRTDGSLSQIDALGSAVIIHPILITLVICIIIDLIIGRTKHRRGFKEYTQSITNQLECSEAWLDRYREEYTKYVREHSKILNDLTPLEEHVAELEKTATNIDITLQKHYSLGIIPPDYRDMVHVLYINRAFRNDQVDTMREATLLCDRDIQHSEVIGGLHEIASAISSLAPVLEDISYKIGIMNAELKSIADGQDKLLSETESARYATEAVQKSQESLLWYERQKWYRSNS